MGTFTTSRMNTHTLKIVIGIVLVLIALFLGLLLTFFAQIPSDEPLSPSEWAKIREEERRYIEERSNVGVTEAEAQERRAMMEAAETMHEDKTPITESERYLLAEQLKKAYER